MNNILYFKRQRNLRAKYVFGLIAFGVLCLIICLLGVCFFAQLFPSAKDADSPIVLLWMILCVGGWFVAYFWIAGLIPETPENIHTAIKRMKSRGDDSIRSLEYYSTIIESGSLFRRRHTFHGYNLLEKNMAEKKKTEESEELRVYSEEIMNMIKKNDTD